ncbi:MAG TPA: glutamate-1-semialdehyde 2,1-aminomutase [Candidatus Acidoferrales bacterium]|nr:glutamate-1-semialdehyde 2,1-aminomutase [Candidatus Acidoferrales bacterium]
MVTTRSKQLFAKAEKYIPGGVNSPVRAWKSVGGDPLFIARGKGSYIYDADNNKYTDYCLSWGPLILGHADPHVIKSICQTAKQGTTFGAPNALEIELAEKISNAIPSIEMIRFVNSGTEATMSAIRVARAYTKRDKIIKFIGGYHGHADFLLAKAGSGITTLGIPDSAGVPKKITASTLLAPYNNLKAVEDLFNKYKQEIAAVIVEPIAGNMGIVVPEKSFLTGLRKLTKANQSLLIFDEVITGFRAGWGGAQSLFGITPDLTCLGKIIGGGLPVGAYGGNKKIMSLIAPLGPVYQAGTLSGNPIAMAAGIATLNTIASDSNFYIQLEKYGEQLELGITQAAKKAAIPVTINRIGSMMTVFFSKNPVTDYSSALTANTQMYAKFFLGMLQKGNYFPPSQFETLFISSRHTKSIIAKTISDATLVLQTLM